MTKRLSTCSGPAEPGSPAPPHRWLSQSKKDAEWKIRAGFLGVTAPESQPASQWPSQTDVADGLLVTRAWIGQVLSGDRTRWSKDPMVTAFRHDLCEQIQRLGGVVTITEIIDLTILLRPAANTMETSISSAWLLPWHGRRSKPKT